MLAADHRSLYRSTDGGGSWTSCDWATDQDARVLDIMFHPATSGLVYIGTDRGVYKSVDSGVSWTHLTAGAGSVTVTSVAGDPSDSSVVIVASANGPYKSTDGGATFVLCVTGLPEPVVLEVQFVSALSGVVLAGTGQGVYRSRDGGRSWAPASGGPTGTVTDFAEHGTGSLFATSIGGGGVYRSSTGGSSWTRVRAGDALSVCVTGAGDLIAALSDGAMARSTNQGSSWSSIAAPGSAGCTGLSANFGIGDEVYAVIRDRAQRDSALWKRDGATSIWTEVATGHEAGDGPARVACSRRASEEVWVLAGGSHFGTGTLDCRRSVDAASSWRSSGWSRGFCVPHAIATSSNDALVTLAARHGSGMPWINSTLGLSGSDGNGGVAWADVTPRLAGVVLHLNDVEIRGGTTQQLWAAGGTVLDTNGASDTSWAVVRSDDDGVGWTDVSPAGVGSAVLCVSHDGDDGARVLVGTMSNGVQFSGDNGSTWQTRGLTNTTVHDLHVTTAGRCYAATSAGPFYSDDWGQNWSALGAALDGKPVTSIVASGDHVYAGVNGRGVWSIDSP